MFMSNKFASFFLSIAAVAALALSACANLSSSNNYGAFPNVLSQETIDYSKRLPPAIEPPFEKVVLVDPNVHAWGAYGPDGNLIKAGLATAGSTWCSDISRPCKTKPGTFRINYLGPPNCKSTLFPIPFGGAPMPYCMFFNKNQALHGTPADHVVEGNVSHGCVRMRVEDAFWLRYYFAAVGTKVIVKSY